MTPTDEVKNNNDRILYKIHCFEYFLNKITEKKAEITGTSYEEVLERYSRLISLKLLFLTSTVKVTRDYAGLLNIFDSFYAMEYGAVETDIFRAMVDDKMELFDFSDIITKLKKKNFGEIKISDDDARLIDESIDKLLEINPNILSEGAYELVQMTQKWASWKIAFRIVKFMGRRSGKMKEENIQNDIKVYK